MKEMLRRTFESHKFHERYAAGRILTSYFDLIKAYVFIKVRNVKKRNKKSKCLTRVLSRFTLLKTVSHLSEVTDWSSSFVLCCFASLLIIGHYKVLKCLLPTPDSETYEISHLVRTFFLCTTLCCSWRRSERNEKQFITFSSDRSWTGSCEE